MKTETLTTETLVGRDSVEPAWFFKDHEACDRLRREAIEWLSPPTPFREFSMAKGRGGGIDCAGLWQALHEAAGVAPRGYFNFQRMTSDYSSASALLRMVHYVRGQGSSLTGTVDPQSTELAHIYAELTKETPLMIGDVLLFRHGGQFHVAIMIDPPHFVNALPGRGVVEGNANDFNYNQYFIALFRARATKSVSNGSKLISGSSAAGAAQKG